MQAIKEQVAYLRGLIDGSDYLAREGKDRVIWERMLELFSSIASELDELKTRQTDLEQYAEALDDDLADAEEEIFGEAEGEDEEFVEMECPQCREAVRFAEDLLYEDDVEVTCPNCGEVVYSSEPDEEGEENGQPGGEPGKDE
ncbi:MAG: CD1247 N-terminal domain-containing protein [Chitinophagales bacterium]